MPSIGSGGDLRLRDVLAADDSAGRGVVEVNFVVLVPGPGEEWVWGEMEGV